VTRYIGKYGTDRVRKAVLIGTLGPYLVKASDNPEGVDPSVFEGLKNAIRADRPATVFDFLKNFYNYDVNGGKLVSDRVLEDNWNVAAGAPHWNAAVRRFLGGGFSARHRENTVPTLIIHGDADRILPPDATSRRQAKMIKHVTFRRNRWRFHTVCCWTHADSRERRIGALCGMSERKPSAVREVRS